MRPPPTYNSGGLRGLDERQRAVVGLFGHVDKALLQLVLLEDALQLVEKPHPLVPLVVGVGQDQDGRLVTGGGGQLGSSHLEGFRGQRLGLLEWHPTTILKHC